MLTSTSGISRSESTPGFGTSRPRPSATATRDLSVATTCPPTTEPTRRVTGSSARSTSRPSGTRRTPSARRAGSRTLAAREGLPSAVVAQAWLDRDDVEDVLARQAACPLVRGIRHKPAAAPSPGRRRRRALRDRWATHGGARGYARLARHGLSFDLQTPWWHLREAAALARAFPDTRIVLNHTGLPADRSAEGLRGWRDGHGDAGRRAERRRQDLRARRARPALDRRVEPRGRPDERSISSASTARCSRRTSPWIGLVATLRHDLRGVQRDRAGLLAGGPTAPLPRQRRPLLSPLRAQNVASDPCRGSEHAARISPRPAPCRADPRGEVRASLASRGLSADGGVGYGRREPG